MIKAFAVILLIAATGSSVSEFTLSPEESFTLHFDHDYIFRVSECGPTCVSLSVSQMSEERATWTGQLFDLHEDTLYPLQMTFSDVIFDSVYVVSMNDAITLRVSYREATPVVSNERLVKAASEKETMGKVSVFIILEFGAVVFLIFFAAHRILKRKGARKSSDGDFQNAPSSIPGPVMGFHGQWNPGIPRQEEGDPDLELLQHIREMEALEEMEIKRRMRRRLEEEDNLGLDWI